MAVATPCWPAPVSAMTRCFPHAPRQQGLPERVVDLVGARVVQVLPLEVYFCAIQLLREPCGMVERRLAARVLTHVICEFLSKGLVLVRPAIGCLQLNQGGHQRLGGVAAPENPEMAVLVG